MSAEDSYDSFNAYGHEKFEDDSFSRIIETSNISQTAGYSAEKFDSDSNYFQAPVELKDDLVGIRDHWGLDIVLEAVSSKYTEDFSVDKFESESREMNTETVGASSSLPIMLSPRLNAHFETEERLGILSDSGSIIQTIDSKGNVRKPNLKVLTDTDRPVTGVLKRDPEFHLIFQSNETSTSDPLSSKEVKDLLAKERLTEDFSRSTIKSTTIRSDPQAMAQPTPTPFSSYKRPLSSKTSRQSVTIPATIYRSKGQSKVVVASKKDIEKFVKLDQLDYTASNPSASQKPSKVFDDSLLLNPHQKQVSQQSDIPDKLQQDMVKLLSKWLEDAVECSVTHQQEHNCILRQAVPVPNLLTTATSRGETINSDFRNIRNTQEINNFHLSDSMEERGNGLGVDVMRNVMGASGELPEEEQEGQGIPEYDPDYQYAQEFSDFYRLQQKQSTRQQQQRRSDSSARIPDVSVSAAKAKRRGEGKRENGPSQGDSQTSRKDSQASLRIAPLSQSAAPGTPATMFPDPRQTPLPPPPPVAAAAAASRGKATRTVVTTSAPTAVNRNMTRAAANSQPKNQMDGDVGRNVHEKHGQGLRNPLPRVGVKYEYLHDKSERIYANFLDDMIAACRERAAACESIEDITMHRVLSEHVRECYLSAEKMTALRSKMVSAVIESSE